MRFGAAKLMATNFVDAHAHDRDRLEGLCCECYAVVKKEFDRLLPDEVAI